MKMVFMSSNKKNFDHFCHNNIFVDNDYQSANTNLKHRKNTENNQSFCLSNIEKKVRKRHLTMKILKRK